MKIDKDFFNPNIPLTRKKRYFVFFIAVIALLLDVWGDYATGIDVNFSILYLVPIALFTWFFDFKAGILSSLISILCWILTDLATGTIENDARVMIWNTFVSLGTFLIVSFALDRIKQTLIELEKNRQKLMRSYNEIQKLSNLKSDLVQMVSHEFRSPIFVISAGMERLLGKDADRLNEEQLTYLKLTKQNIERLTRLVSNLLDLASIEKGKKEFAPAKHSINQSVREVVQLYKPILAERGIELCAECDERIPETVFDADSIAQVLTNLVSNAMKFTARGQITVGTVLKYSVIEAYVKDTGIGMSPEQMKKLFIPFSKINRPVIENASGTGLGLVISKELIERHKGSIWVESEPDEGTTFYFSLPLRNSFTV